MDKVKVINDEYTNIQGVGAKKIKLTKSNLISLYEEAKKAINIDIKPIDFEEEIKPKEKVESIKTMFEENPKPLEETPAYFHNEDKKDNDKALDETISNMKQEMEGSYKNLGNFKIKDTESKKETPVTMEAVKDLLNKVKDSTIMVQEINEIAIVIENYEAKLNDCKRKKVTLSNLNNDVVKCERIVEEDKKHKEERIKEMKNASLFEYLKVGQNELENQLKIDGHALRNFSDIDIAGDLENLRRANENIVMNIEGTNSTLQNTFSANQNALKVAAGILNEFNNIKRAIDDESKQVSEKMNKYAKELNDFNANAVNVLKNIYNINKQVQVTKQESEKAVSNKFAELENERNKEVGINLTIPEDNTSAVELEQPIVSNSVPNNMPNLNIFESYRQETGNFKPAASQGGTEAADVFTSNFVNDYEEPFINHRRAA